MATILPSLMNSAHGFDVPSSHVKPERFFQEDDSEISRWLEEPIPFCTPSTGYTNTPSTNTNVYQGQTNLQNPFGSFPNSCGFTFANQNSFNPSHSYSGVLPFAHPNQSGVPIQAQLNGVDCISPQMLSQIPQNLINPLNFQQQTQFYHLFAQFQQLFNKGQEIETPTDDKKRRPMRPLVRRVRQTRPKVVEAKGAVQCKGRNRKKNTQCRNAALMEYMGPRPIYCAEHIELDPKSLYEKCKAGYQKEPGDNKGCKEVVLKEFGLCYKHYPDVVNEIVRTRNFERAKKHQERIGELLTQLEKEAAAAKRKDGDLYQRKNKLIPKFQEMKKIISKALEIMKAREDGQAQDEFEPVEFIPAVFRLNMSPDNELSVDVSEDDSDDCYSLPSLSPDFDDKLLEPKLELVL